MKKLTVFAVTAAMAGVSFAQQLGAYARVSKRVVQDNALIDKPKCVSKEGEQGSLGVYITPLGDIKIQAFKNYVINEGAKWRIALRHQDGSPAWNAVARMTIYCYYKNKRQ